MIKPKDTEPIITIDPLQPEGDHWFFTVAVQGDVQATIAVRPDLRYAGGYVLERATDRVNRDAAGSMGRKQEARAKALLAVLEERVLEALARAGWSLLTHTPQGDPVWHYDRPPAVSVESRQQARQVVTQRRAHGLARYQRTIQMRSVTFVCAWCQEEVTQQRYPGQLRYCSEACQRESAREQTRVRAQRFRAREQTTSASPGKRPGKK